MTAREVAALISSGQADDDLDLVYRAFRERDRLVRAEQSSRMSLTLRVGTKAKLKGIRPKALIGSVVTIQEVRNTRAVISFDDAERVRIISRGRFGHTTTTVPLACLSIQS